MLILKCPTEDICQYNLLDGAILQELPTFVSLLKTSSEVLTEDHLIWEEIKVFHNVRDKYRRILHSDKCSQLLQRVGSCLRKFVSLNVSKTYLDLAEQFHVGLQSSSLPILLPSRQHLEYVLFHTQSAAKLICKILRYSKEAFCYIIQRLRMGRLILNLMMALSVTSRINIVFRYILVQLFDIYKNLYVWHEKLKTGITEWPKPLELPEDLEAWLSPETSNLLGSQEDLKSEANFLSHFFENQKTEPENINEDESVIARESSEFHLENLDVGEVVPRPKKQKKKRKRELSETEILLLEEIQNANSLKKLKTILSDLDASSQDALPRRILTPRKKISIKRIFRMASNRLKKIKELDLTTTVKKKRKSALVRLIKTKLVKYLELIQTESAPSENAASCSIIQPHSVVQSVKQLRPAKSLKQFKKLFNTLLKMLQSVQHYEKASKLNKVFKNRRINIRNLIKNGERNAARELIIRSSEDFLTFCQ